jgi:ribosomal protein S18 acetylase RimI-like enzyme
MTAHTAWPTALDDALLDGVHRVVVAVTAAGGAVGWLQPPTRSECRDWVADLLAEVVRGDAALCVARDGGADGTVMALGAWRRDHESIFRHRASIVKVMAHPESRGQGLGTLISSQLVAHARAAGLEHVRLRVRGNNHGAIGVYERLGFVEYGRLPNAIAVDDYRFDEVWFYLPLSAPAGLRLIGGTAEGPGASPGSR